MIPSSRAAVLVTGCAGFIAARVCHHLLDAGFTVLGVDNLCATYDPQLKAWRNAQLLARPRFSFHACDVAQRNDVNTLFQQASTGSGTPPFAAVLHLAARAGVRYSVEHPEEYVDVNIHAALNVFEACRRFGVAKVVLASTSSVYGDSTPAPFSEHAACDRPLSPYAASKRAAEMLAYAYHHLHRLDVSVLRFFTVYGPAGRPDMSVFRFIRHIIEGEPITVFGDGEQLRDFTYVDDIARGVIAAIRPLGYEIVNLGGSKTWSVNSLIAMLSEIIGRKAHVEHRPPVAADVSLTEADISRAQQLLDWSPIVSLPRGLQQCVAWYRDHRDFARSLSLKG